VTEEQATTEETTSTEPQTAPADTTPEPEASSADEPTPEAAIPAPRGEMKNGYYWGLGRRKSAVARVRIRPGEGKFEINSRTIEKYFGIETYRKAIAKPLEVTQTTKGLDVFVNVVGGGPTGQAGAIVLGLARALCVMEPDHRTALLEGNYLTRDPREVERKKYGQRGARRRFQFSKR
jgi:small subunit ribosomal protein S9